MKSDFYEERYFCECKCGDPEHLLVFDFWKWRKEAEDEDGDIDVYFTSNWHQTLWQRIKMAFKFIFFRESFYLSDSVWITKENIHQLEAVINKIKGELK